MTWLDSIKFLQWLSARDLLVFWCLGALFNGIIAVAMWISWRDSLQTRLGIATLVTGIALIFEGFRSYFGYDLPVALSWLQAGFAGGANIVAWLWLWSLCNSRFRLRSWHYGLFVLAIVARLTTTHLELAMFDAGYELAPGLFVETMLHIDWAIWQIGLVGMGSVLILAAPGSRSTEARRGWVLLTAAVAYEIIVTAITRATIDGLWPVNVIFASGMGAWLLWGTALIYLLRHPGLQIGPSPAAPGATVAG